MKDKTGGPAFPLYVPGNACRVDHAAHGASLRDYLAAKAMQGLLAAWGQHDGTEFDEIAASAYTMADAMLAEREK